MLHPVCITSSGKHPVQKPRGNWNKIDAVLSLQRTRIINFGGHIPKHIYESIEKSGPTNELLMFDDINITLLNRVALEPIKSGLNKRFALPYYPKKLLHIYWSQTTESTYFMQIFLLTIGPFSKVSCKVDFT